MAPLQRNAKKRMILRKPFRQVVRLIAQGIDADLRLEKAAFEALQDATEAFIASHFEGMASVLAVFSALPVADIVQRPSAERRTAQMMAMPLVKAFLQEMGFTGRESEGAVQSVAKSDVSVEELARAELHDVPEALRAKVLKTAGDCARHAGRFKVQKKDVEATKVLLKSFGILK